MPIKVKQFVNSVKKAIAEIATDERQLLTLVRVESCLAMCELEALLDAHSECEENVSPATLKPFTDFLSDRWQKIATTSSVYPHSPFSKINLACLALAQQLIKPLKVAHPYMLMMPDLPFATAKTSKSGGITALSLNEFVLGDQLRPIEVLACLDNYAANPQGDYYHTSLPERVPLSKRERLLVIRHSKESFAYNTEIKIDSGAKEEFRRRFVNALESNQCRVDINCGESQREVLLGVITENIHSVSDLAKMLCRLPKNLYLPFLGQIKESSFKAMLNGESFDECIRKESNYTDDERYNKSMLFLFSYLYWRLYREREGINNTMFGLGCILGSYTREEKHNALLFLQHYLLGDNELLTFKDHIKGVGVSAAENELAFDESLNINVKTKLTYREQSALQDGRLGAITNMADVVGKPDFKQSYQQRVRVILGPSAVADFKAI